jgi:hypothetical protein
MAMKGLSEVLNVLNKPNQPSGEYLNRAKAEVAFALDNLIAAEDLANNVPIPAAKAVTAKP